MNRASTGPQFAPAHLVLFLMTALLAVAMLAACDSGTAATSTANPDSAISQAAPGLARGKAVFARYCNTCHPGGGRGAGPSLIEQAPGMSDDQIKTSVRNGRPRMSSFNETLISNDALTDLVAYIRTMR